MNSLFLIRGLFALVALIFLSTHAGSPSRFAYGVGIVLLAGGLDLFVRRLNLRVFTLTTIGLFFWVFAWKSSDFPFFGLF